MEENKLSYEQWSIELEKSWSLETEVECKAYCSLMYSIDGTESIDFLHKIIESIRLEFDHGIYESTCNAIYRFSSKNLGHALGEILPSFEQRMGKWDQVCRFYLSILYDEEARLAFLEEAKKWNNQQNKVVQEALLIWSIDDEEWESIIEDLGYKIPMQTLDPIPNKWPDDWKERLEAWRKDADVGKANSNLFWKKGKDYWIKDLDFLVEALTLSQGKKWREINVWTNPLWFFAKTTTYPILSKS